MPSSSVSYRLVRAALASGFRPSAGVKWANLYTQQNVHAPFHSMSMLQATGHCQHVRVIKGEVGETSACHTDFSTFQPPPNFSY